jgi:hypothetical protein
LTTDPPRIQTLKGDPREDKAMPGARAIAAPEALRAAASDRSPEAPRAIPAPERSGGQRLQAHLPSVIGGTRPYDLSGAIAGQK